MRWLCPFRQWVEYMICGHHDTCFTGRVTMSLFLELHAKVLLCGAPSRSPETQLSCRKSTPRVRVYEPIPNKLLFRVTWTYSGEFGSIRRTTRCTNALECSQPQRYTWCALYTDCGLLTYSMEQSASWEANRFSVSQEIPHFLWNPKVHKCPPRVPLLSQIDPVLPPHIPLPKDPS
jgi:hypothetical protein